jgi:hypothetical protein
MLGRRSAVWLVGGWLLMLPPENDRSAPVQKWTQEEAFDSARACEESRHNPPKYLPDKVAEVWLRARCVPAEYIYPPAARPSGTAPAHTTGSRAIEKSRQGEP